MASGTSFSKPPFSMYCPGDAAVLGMVCVHGCRLTSDECDSGTRLFSPVPKPCHSPAPTLPHKNPHKQTKSKQTKVFPLSVAVSHCGEAKTNSSYSSRLKGNPQVECLLPAATCWHTLSLERTSCLVSLTGGSVNLCVGCRKCGGVHSVGCPHCPLPVQKSEATLKQSAKGINGLFSHHSSSYKPQQNGKEPGAQKPWGVPPVHVSSTSDLSRCLSQGCQSNEQRTCWALDTALALP